MAKVETVGTYQFQILESGLSLTKNSFPQWTARLKAVAKFIETPDEMAHFQKQGALPDGQSGYVDYQAFGEEIVAYLVLFKSATDFGKDTQLLNYEQLQLALGWDGTEFDSLTNGSHVGKTILGRVEENTYEGKTSLRVNWIDKADASPERQLKSVDAAQVKSLSAILKQSRPTPKAAAKPVTAKPAVGAVSAPATVATSAASLSTNTPAIAPAPKRGPGRPPKTAAAPAAPAPVTDTPPAETTKEAAWEYVQNNRGSNEDNVVTDAWISTCGEICPDKDEDRFTSQEWAKIRDTVLRDLAS